MSWNIEALQTLCYRLKNLTDRDLKIIGFFAYKYSNNIPMCVHEWYSIKEFGLLFPGSMRSYFLIGNKNQNDLYDSFFGLSDLKSILNLYWHDSLSAITIQSMTRVLKEWLDNPQTLGGVE